MSETATIAYAVIALIGWVFVTAWNLGQCFGEPDAGDYVESALFAFLLAATWPIWVVIALVCAVAYAMGRLGGWVLKLCKWLTPRLYT